MCNSCKVSTSKTHINFCGLKCSKIRTTCPSCHITYSGSPFRLSLYIRCAQVYLYFVNGHKKSKKSFGFYINSTALK